MIHETHRPCSCSTAGLWLDGLCDDCWVIKRAEDRQRQELEDIYAGRRTRAWGVGIDRPTAQSNVARRLRDGFNSIKRSEHLDVFDEDEA